MKRSIRLALLVCASFVGLAFAGPALAAYNPSLTIEQTSYKLGAPATADVLAGTLIRLLRPGGAVLALFAGGGSSERSYTRYVIEDEGHLRYRIAPAACGRQRVLQNRDIVALFPGLKLFDSVLLKSGVREVLFRKPDEL